MIKELSKEIHVNARNKGFYDKERNIGEMIALIHSEVSEALEADRNGKSCSCSPTEVNRLEVPDVFKYSFQTNIKDSFEDELADIMIRVMDLAEHKGVDLEGHIIAKMRYNTMREHKHGKLY